MISLDHMFSREYDQKSYHCLHFAAEVWQQLTGQDILNALMAFHGPSNSDKRETVRAFERIETPVEPCIVVMQAPRIVPHVGIWLSRKVFHFNSNGAQLQPLAVALGLFKTARFYQCKR